MLLQAHACLHSTVLPAHGRDIEDPDGQLSDSRNAGSLRQVDRPRAPETRHAYRKICFRSGHVVDSSVILNSD